MTVPSTSSERVEVLLYISDQIYPILEQHVGDEINARYILRVGLSSIATALGNGFSFSQAGTEFDNYLAHKLITVDYGHYETYRTPLKQPSLATMPTDLAQLANDYSDTLRGTQLQDHTQEPDSIHALHLTALAVPYARAHYPALDPGKVALYSFLHDLTEAITGDIPTFNISDADLAQKKQNEARALETLRARYGKKWPELIDAIEAYESLADAEAAFVKSMDKNDPGYTHYRNHAYALRTLHGVKDAAAYKEKTRANIQRTLPYASTFPLVVEDKYELADRIATFIGQ